MLTSLDHVAVAVRDLGVARDRYCALFGREPDRQGVGGSERVRFQLGNVALEIVGAGADDVDGQLRSHLDLHGEGIWAIAFATTDLAKARHVLERRGIASGEACVSSSSETDIGVVPKRKTAALAYTATHGPNIHLVEQSPARPRTSPLTNANGEVTGLDHVVVTTSQPERAIALYGARLGLEMKLDRTNPDWGSRLIFFRCGDSIVEIAHSLKSIDATAPDKIWGVTWRVADIDRAATRIAKAGFAVSEIRSGRKPGTRVCTIRDAPAGVPTLLLSQNKI